MKLFSLRNIGRGDLKFGLRAYQIIPSDRPKQSSPTLGRKWVGLKFTPLVRGWAEMGIRKGGERGLKEHGSPMPGMREGSPDGRRGGAGPGIAPCNLPTYLRSYVPTARLPDFARLWRENLVFAYQQTVRARGSLRQI